MERHARAGGKIDAIVLAGSRPGGDPLADAAHVPTKALVPIAGKPMIDHVVRALIDHPRIGTVRLMAQSPGILLDHPQTSWLGDNPDIRLATSSGGISQSLLDWMGSTDGVLPVLVTTADNVLLDRAIIDAFLSQADGADIAAAMVERRFITAAYPDARRTWLKFRGGAWSGANLFWLGSNRAANALRKWREIEQDRKKGWKIVLAFGPFVLIGAALRLLTIHQAIASVGKRLGVAARIIPIEIAEACIDADKPDDIRLIEQIIAEKAAR